MNLQDRPSGSVLAPSCHNTGSPLAETVLSGGGESGHPAAIFDSGCRLAVRGLAAALLALQVSCAGTATKDKVSTQPVPHLAYIGQALLAPGYTFEGTRVGGLSGIDCAPNTGFCFVISDDLSVHGPARFYTVWIDLGDGRLEDGDVRFLDVTMLRDKTGAAFPKHTVDPEAIRYEPRGGTLFWSSEGKVDQGVNPMVRQMRVDGTFLRELPLPEKFIPDGRGTRGVRQTLGPEGLGLASDGTALYVAMENALAQDGPVASLSEGSRPRVLRFDLPGTPGSEVVYLTDPVARAPVPPGSFKSAGLVEILALDADRFLAMERSFSRGAGFTAKIYVAEFRQATNVAAAERLRGSDVEPVRKHLLADLSELGIPLFNLEGLSFGPVLADGSRSLVLVSDDNFNSRQRTQFLAFRLIDNQNPLSE